MRILSSILVLVLAQNSFAQVSAGVGTGALFYQGDEEFNSSVVFNLMGGYGITDNVSLEASYGYLPFLEADSSAASDSSRWHLDDSQAHRMGLDLFYHFTEGREEGKLRPNVAATGGAMYYNNTLEDGGHWDAFVGAGGGASYALGDNLDLRGDYRLLVEPDDRDINHLAGLSLVYFYDSSDDEGATLALSEDADRMAGLKTIYFGFDQSLLTEESKSRLQQNAQWLKDNPEAKIVLEGHCDERGTNEYNLALGDRRASAARRYLEDLGISPDRLSVVSYGEEVPAVSGSNEEAWAKNRRVECVRE